MGFAERLKELRKEYGINQRTLADMCGLSPQSISSFEKGINSPTVPSLLAISNALDVSTDYLLERTDELGAVAPIEKPASQYTEDELRLLRLFGQMTGQQQARLFAYAEGMLGVPLAGRKAR